MKKIIAILMCALTILALVSCAGGAKKAKVIDIALTDEEYAYAVKKGNTELLAKLNEFLAEIKANGTFDAITNKYFGDGTPTAVTSAKEMKTDGSQLIVATNAEFAPFEYTKGDSYYGIDMEVMKLFADKLGKELYINDMLFESVVLAVGGENAACDVAAAGMTVTDIRKETLDFSESYYKASQMVVVKGSDTAFDSCKTAEDVEKILKGYDKAKKAGVQTGTTGQYFCEGSEDWGFDGFGFTTQGYDAAALAVQDMVNGNLDFVIVDEGPAKMIVDTMNKAG